jgi:RHS repeat-associated protein
MNCDSSTNRITGVSYDAAGNMLSDGSGAGSHTYTWDAENHLLSVAVQGISTTTFTYNALGERVEKSVSGSTPQYYYYDGFGNQAGVRNADRSWAEMFFPRVGGKNYVKYQNGTTYFMHTDLLGTTGMATDQAGVAVQDIMYYPWGGVWGQYNYLDEQFADMQERDAESGLDPTPNRLYYNYLGRWMSPDPLGGDITNPQSLNRYAYVMNNPVSASDPTGMNCQQTGTCAQSGLPHPVSCSNMNCAWQYYSGAGSLSSYGNNLGGIDVSQTVCYEDEVLVNCNSTLGNITHGSPTALIEFATAQAAAAAAGTGGYPVWVAPGQESSTLAYADSGDVIGAQTGDYLPGFWTTEEYPVYSAPADYLQLTVNIGFMAGGTFTLSVDKYARVYAGAGGNLGKSPTPFSASFHGGHVLGPSPASAQAVSNVLTGAGCSAGGGIGWGGFGYFNLFKSGTAWSQGATTPQLGISCTVSTRIF